MHTQTSHINWFYLLEENLSPSLLNQKETDTISLLNFYKDLVKDIKLFRPHFVDVLSRSEKYAENTLIQLVVASDVVYGYLVEIANRSSTIDKFIILKQLYQKILRLLELQIDTCSRFSDKIYLTLPLTAYSTQNIRIDMRYKFELFKKDVRCADTNLELRELTISAFKLLIEKKKLFRYDVEYFDLLIKKIKNRHFKSDKEMEDFLYQYDFNSPSFLMFIIKKCNCQLTDTVSLHKQLELIYELEDRFNGLSKRTQLRWMNNDLSIHVQLKNFIKEKKVLIKQKIKLRRSEIEDSKFNMATDRMLVKLPVAQFGLFIRLFMEKGLLPKEEVGKTFAHYARHFSTPNTPFISAESLQKKSTDVEFSTAKKMKGHLIGMVNWLNEHYNVSNHRDS